MTVIGPTPALLPPNYGALSYTDSVGVTLDATKARFNARPVVLSGYERAAPGARIRFRTNAQTITPKFVFNYETAWAGVYHDIISVYVDGAFHSDLNPADALNAFTYEPSIDFGSVLWRTVEFVMPYAADADFYGVSVDPKYIVYRADPRPAKRLVTVGDSITHGLAATKTVATWPFRLAEAKGWELVNIAAASHTTNASDGTAAAALDPDVVTVLIGYNDFDAQLALATYKSRLASLINNILSGAPSARVYVITPTWTNTSKTITIGQYRTAVSEVVAEIADADVILIDGTTLGTQSTAHFPGGIHPNDAGSAAIAAALATVVSAP